MFWGYDSEPLSGWKKLPTKMRKTGKKSKYEGWKVTRILVGIGYVQDTFNGMIEDKTLFWLNVVSQTQSRSL